MSAAAAATPKKKITLIDIDETGKVSNPNELPPELVRGIEELPGRCVVAFFSDNHMDPDTAMEAFLLAPSPT